MLHRSFIRIFALISLFLGGCRTQTEIKPEESKFTIHTYSPGTSHPNELKVFHRSKPLLGTFVTITVYGHQSAPSLEAINAAFLALEEADKLMSIHREDSEITYLNQKAANEQVPVSPELFKVLFQAQEIATLTDGAFDITVGPLTHLWGFLWKKYHLSSQAELKQVLPLVGYRHLQLFPNGMVHFQRQGMFLDLGGIGKGVAVDMAIDVLKQHGIPAAMVKAGGDLRVYGTPPGQSGWVIPLEGPAEQGKTASILLTEGALSTSGNYENFFIVDNKLFSHIINPKTGLPVDGIAACTVLAKTCAESDAWATAFICYGADRSLEKFGSHFPMRFTLMPKKKGGKFKVRESPSFPKVL